MLKAELNAAPGVEYGSEVNAAPGVELPTGAALSMQFRLCFADMDM
jgi:hypothetical protein